jgi:hypothetical protein
MDWTDWTPYYIAYGYIMLVLIEEAISREDTTALWLFQIERAHYKKELRSQYK